MTYKSLLQLLKNKSEEELLFDITIGGEIISLSPSDWEVIDSPFKN